MYKRIIARKHIIEKCFTQIAFSFCSHLFQLVWTVPKARPTSDFRLSTGKCEKSLFNATFLEPSYNIQSPCQPTSGVISKIELNLFRTMALSALADYRPSGLEQCAMEGRCRWWPHSFPSLPIQLCQLIEAIKGYRGGVWYKKRFQIDFDLSVSASAHCAVSSFLFSLRSHFLPLFLANCWPPVRTKPRSDAPWFGPPPSFPSFAKTELFKFDRSASSSTTVL